MSAQDSKRATFTPGPWTASQTTSKEDLTRTIWAGPRPGLAPLIAKTYRLCTDTELICDEAANARLIAAAPDMLAALQNLFDQCCNGSFERPFSKDENALLDAARAALAKVEGR